MAAVERPGLAALRAYRQRLLAQGRLVEAGAVHVGMCSAWEFCEL